MKNKTKKYLSLFLSLTILLGCFGIGFTAFGDDLVAIDAANFPDPVFRNMILNFKDKDGNRVYDKNGDGYLNAEERKVSLISVSGSVSDGNTVKTLKGIEYFADTLTNLRCGGIGLEELDVSALYNLTSLTCEGNWLESLDVSNNKKLITLDCMGNDLSSLTLGSLPQMEKLHCYANFLTDIDVSQLPNLVDFRCDQNELTSLDVSRNTRLEEFRCAMNHLTTLDLSNNPLLVSPEDDRTVISKNIGDQTTTASASLNGVEIVIPFPLKNYQYVTSSSLDKDGANAYMIDEFVAYDVADFADGVDYTYAVGLDGSEDMTVHIDVSRDFYQVNFYTGEDMQELLGKSFVAENGSAVSPKLPSAPTCKVFDKWSQDVTNVTSDMQVYIVWKDSHSYALSNFENGIATITCTLCGDSYTVAFKDCINATPNDSNYCEYIDVVDDGYINAKDYAQLEKMF